MRVSSYAFVDGGDPTREKQKPSVRGKSADSPVFDTFSETVTLHTNIG